MIWIVMSIVAAAVAADYGVWRRYMVPRISCAGRARLVIAALWTADAVPLLLNAANLVVADNTQTFCDVGTWMMFAFLVTVVPKTIIFVSLLASRRPAVRIVGAVGAAAVVAMLIYGVVQGRTDLVVNRVEIRSQRLPDGFDGFRIALFSDLHIGALLDAEAEMARVVDSINSLNADIVFFCGDLVNIRHTELDRRRMAILSRLRSVHGTYSVTGNHDTGFYVADSVTLPLAESRRLLLEKERRMGWHPVDGRSIHIRRGGDSISVTGIAFDDELNKIRHSRNIPQLDIAGSYSGVAEDTYNITLAHIPQMWPQVRALGRGDLTLSGHVHAMQMKFRIFGRSFSPARIRYRHWSGLYGDAEGRLYVNDGIGSVGIPARIGARPEITLITLRR